MQKMYTKMKGRKNNESLNCREYFLDLPGKFSHVAGPNIPHKWFHLIDRKTGFILSTRRCNCIYSKIKKRKYAYIDPNYYILTYIISITNPRRPKIKGRDPN
ncbi:hypothetical protein DM860_012251 [Cuscuta australis]|uniref:Uncharacterized protein n=1 Tax=Cuscuta australis TaxID=267555 RepID=A0A328E8F3_9ASTE|nr:hypothetical protein DM860_012251 [Cuscuta australis]